MYIVLFGGNESTPFSYNIFRTSWFILTNKRNFINATMFLKCRPSPLLFITGAQGLPVQAGRHQDRQHGFKNRKNNFVDEI